ncbi:dUTP diphosphatase [Lysinibacillus composti]
MVFKEFTVLGEQLGFTWEQVENAYLEKNKINHERQLSGY